MWHKFTVLMIVCLVGTLLLSACASPAPTSIPVPAQNPTSIPAGQVPVPTSAASATTGTVKLTFWMDQESDILTQAEKHLIDVFMAENPNIQVDFEPQTGSDQDYTNKIALGFSAGTGPDVFWVDSTSVDNYAANGSLLPIDKYDTPADLQDIYPFVLKQLTYKGHVWTLPDQQASDAILYNKDMFAAAGLTAPTGYDAPWTFEEFLAAAKKLTQRRADGTTAVWGFATNYDPSIFDWQPFVAAYNGAQMTSPDGSTFNGYLNSADMVQATEWFARLWTTEKVAPVERIPDIFPTGQAAMLTATPTALVAIQQHFPDFASKVGVMPMPCGKTCAVQSGGYTIGISSQTKHPEEAALLALSVAGQAGNQYWVKTTGYLPPRKSTYDALTYLQQPPFSLYMEGLTKFAVVRPPTPAYNVFIDQTNSFVNDIIAGGDVQAGLNKITPIIEAEQQKYK